MKLKTLGLSGLTAILSAVVVVFVLIEPLTPEGRYFLGLIVLITVLALWLASAKLLKARAPKPAKPGAAVEEDPAEA